MAHTSFIAIKVDLGVCFKLKSDYGSQNPILLAKRFASQFAFVRIIYVKITQINMNIESTKSPRCEKSISL